MLWHIKKASFFPSPRLFSDDTDFCVFTVSQSPVIHEWGFYVVVSSAFGMRWEGNGAVIISHPLNSINVNTKFSFLLISLTGDMEIFAYFFGPIGILLCVNVLLFLSTARQLTCGLWKRDDVKSTTER